MNSPAEFQRALIDLLPPGLAWTRDPDSILGRILGAMGDGLARAQGRAYTLVTVEADPRHTIQLLADWEQSCGLPDPCAGPAQTIPERQAAIVARLTDLGGQAPADHVALAASLGYAITITQFSPTCADQARAGDEVTGDAYAGWFRVNAPLTTLRLAQSDLARAGDPLGTFGNQQLECALTRAVARGIKIIFAYH